MNSRFLSTLFAGLILHLALSTDVSCAQQQDETMEISGIVLNDVTSEPLNKAIVIVKLQSGGQEDARAVSTGMDGQFTLKNLVSRAYTIVVEKPGFSAQTQERPSATPISVNSSKRGLTLRLVPLAIITGRITNLDGEPIIGADVQIMKTRLIDGALSSTPVNRTSTNDLGEYRFWGLQSGRYYLSAFYRDSASAFGLREIPRKSTTEEITFDDYAVTYYPGTHDFTNATALSAKPGQVLRDIDIRLEMTRSATIEGSVRNLPHGAAGHVFLQPSDGRALGANQVFVVDPGKSRFFFKSVPPGDYLLRSQINDQGQNLSAQQSITIRGGPISNIALELAPLPLIKGSIITQEKVPLPEKLALTFNGVSQPMSFRVPVNPDGSFTLRAPMNIYRLGVVSPTKPIMVESLRVDSKNLSSATLEVNRTIESLSVLVTTTVSQMAGTAVTTSGTPIKKGIVIATRTVDEQRQITLASVGQDGSFKLESLLPGDYKVACFLDIDSPDDLTQETLREIEARGEKINIPANTTKSAQVVAITASSK